MAQAIFENPNKPEQPAKGVYRWYYKGKDDGEEVTIYVGSAGGKKGKKAVRKPSTLARGISELQRGGGISSTKGKTLDTDFIVGTAIEYIKKQGFDCYWQHCSNDPRQERKIRDNCIPLLQTRSTRIDKAYKLEEYKGYWTSNKVSEASNRLKSLFTASNMLSPR